MDIRDFDFDLPDELIARYPPKTRGSSRLLVALPAKGSACHTPKPNLVDTTFEYFIDYVNAGDVLVFNDTKVLKARLFGSKVSGGKIEALIERVIDDNTVIAHVRASKSPKPGNVLYFHSDIAATMVARHGDLFELKFADNVWEILERHGELPLPPYLNRTAEKSDEERYQTVYAQHLGAVAAPTAGLHFTDEMLQRLQEKGVICAKVTLHVGAGTFLPVRVDNILEHTMHAERYFIPEETARRVAEAQEKGAKVWAVGTTSLRALESALTGGYLQAGWRETDIFIRPGYRFQVVDRLLTNFHLPKSTLLMLVSALAGAAEVKQIYRHAIENGYRFFSYGDAMILGDITKFRP